MDLHSFTPSDIIENLKCFNCHSSLSHFPISLCSNSKSLCGRCAVPEGMISFQNEALETICLRLKFPCLYEKEGCLEELSPEDVPEHERTCPFRIVKCIVTKPEPCEWSGSLPGLLRHCREAHAEAFVAKGHEFELNLSSCEERDYVIEHDDSFVMFTKKYACEDKTLEFAVYNCEYLSSFSSTCQLKVTCGRTTILHDFEAGTFEEKIYSTVCLPFLRDNDDSIPLAKVTIGEPDCTKTPSSIEKRVGLTCIYCSNFALPPIYRRTVDMTVICRSCGGAGRRCSHCTIPKRVRDPILEQFVLQESYPCIYRHNGCTYISTPSEMTNHQTKCCYKTVRCPIVTEGALCPWEGASRAIEDHFFREHSNLLVDMGEIIDFSRQESNLHQRVLKFGTQMFCLIYILEDKKFVWVVQAIGQCTDNFKYEVRVFDVQDDSFVASMRQICPNGMIIQPFGKQNLSIYFSVGQVLRLQEDGNCDKEAIKFCVQIFKC